MDDSFAAIVAEMKHAFHCDSETVIDWADRITALAQRQQQLFDAEREAVILRAQERDTAEERVRALTEKLREFEVAARLRRVDDDPYREQANWSRENT